MSKSPVASRYAHALLEIGVEQKSFEKYREQLNALAKLFVESREFKNAMLNPSIKLDERKAIMRAIASKVSLDPMICNFTLLLLDNERLRHIGDIASEYQRLADAHAGRIRAHITSAHALEAAQVTRIKMELKKLTGADEVEVDTSVDEELIGGVVTRVGGIVLDGSVRYQLESLRTSVLQDI
ncbi:MAG: ATP synthase F1 subunit delta [Myxococcota bacterium]|jgi:F-type H+-transporting ATPase subunit delta|nr:ATP synthase F1 subunit delta [Myxococcota bacterium]MEC9442644.1 ATP synthase F1 subunit delta [Myxococcota bacterium]